VLGTDEFVEWLSTCHEDYNVFQRVYGHLLDTVDKLELVGPRIDPKWGKKLRGCNGLGEARYNDSGSRAFRSFFKFGRLNGQRVVLFADGDSKTSDDFLPVRYVRAGRLVDEAMAAHGIVLAQDW
jgi:hypothetical protein